MEDRYAFRRRTGRRAVERIAIPFAVDRGLSAGRPENRMKQTEVGRIGQLQLFKFLLANPPNLVVLVVRKIDYAALPSTEHPDAQAYAVVRETLKRLFTAVADLYTQFLSEFPSQGIPIGFTFLNVTAGNIPYVRERGAILPTMREKDLPPIDEHGADASRKRLA